MTAKQSFPAHEASREVIITRLLQAPRELVFATWTDPKHIDQWWGPSGFRNRTLHMDVRPGGMWRYVMHGPNGVDYPNRIVYVDVIAPERLAYWHGSDIDNDPDAFQVIVTFEALGAKTYITMRSIFPTAAAREHVVREYGAIEGGMQTLDRLEEQLAKTTETV